MNADILAQTSGTALAACGILAQRSGLEKKTDQITNSGQENENLNSVASPPPYRFIMADESNRDCYPLAFSDSIINIQKKLE